MSAVDLYRALHAELIRRGRECAVGITGIPEDADDIDTPEKAWAAIDAALKLGIERNNELNALQMKVAQQ